MPSSVISPSLSFSNALLMAEFFCPSRYVSDSGFLKVIGMNLLPSSAIGGALVSAIAAAGSAGLAACGFSSFPGSAPEQQASKYRPSHPAPEAFSGSALDQMSVDRKCDRLKFGYPTHWQIASRPAS